MTKLNLLKAGSVALTLAVMAFPAVSFAATYAYVNQDGDVSIVTADSGLQAIAIAPNIDEHSGVILLTNPAQSGLVAHVVVQ
ncbi:MAG: hypothetical protein PHV42_03065 [Candidatus Pacebacteria bacterium]|nr:hypothetical protein [Candidatus Paceibacterota bacterium]